MTEPQLSWKRSEWALHCGVLQASAVSPCLCVVTGDKSRVFGALVFAPLLGVCRELHSVASPGEPVSHSGPQVNPQCQLQQLWGGTRTSACNKLSSAVRTPPVSWILQVVMLVESPSVQENWGR